MLVGLYNTNKRNIGDFMIRYIVLIIVVVFVSIVILILHYYLKNKKYESEIESEKAEQIWELQKINLQTDL
jgi:hypothetical protein